MQKSKKDFAAQRHCNGYKMNHSSFDDRYRRFIENLDHIPPLPAIVSQLLKVVGSAETSAGDVAELIEKDPALTSKVIRLANSAFYGVPRGVSSVQSAVVILGFHTLKSIVLSTSIIDLFPVNSSGGSFERVRFWKHSILCALTARKIADNLIDRLCVDPQSAFCAGIMHDIGKLIFELFTPREYASVCRKSKDGEMPMSAAETENMGLNHADIGRILSDKWALPLDLEAVIVNHHEPQMEKNAVELVSLINIADNLVHRLDYGLWEKEAFFPEWEYARKVLSIDNDKYERIRVSLPDEIEKFQNFFSIIGG
jgi:HD-like signal output (HDOD) protein